MSAREMAEWIAFDAESPLPDRRQDHHFAALTQHTMNAHTKRKDGRAWRHDDFLLFRPSVAGASEADEAERRRRVAQGVLAMFRSLGPKA